MTLPMFNGDRLGELLALRHGADSVELKRSQNTESRRSISGSNHIASG